MVSHLTYQPGLASIQSKHKWYKRKFSLLIGFCLIAALILWSNSIIHSNSKSTFSACPQPIADLHEVSQNEIKKNSPVTPSLVRISVLNATDQHGAAQKILNNLKLVGFISNKSSIGNDKIYKSGTLTCQGQIRFGTHGLGSAATIRLAFPCAQFVTDARKDSSVDIVLGSDYDKIPANDNTRAALNQISKDSTPQQRLSVANKIQCPVKLR